MSSGSQTQNGHVGSINQVAPAARRGSLEATMELINGLPFVSTEPILLKDLIAKVILSTHIGTHSAQQAVAKAFPD